jgi:2-polyprenyl-6-methoxyphenol hydroxylase-like FAD-dependent oxidoreductase
MMLGLLLARAGVKVTVMEKHADFLRDFRGDTVHASTLRLLDELGLGPRFTQIPHRLIDTVRMEIQNQPVNLDLTHLPGGHQHIALVPQWDFLEMVAAAAEAEPSFRLLRNAEVVGVIRGSGHSGHGADRVVGVTYCDQNGETKEMRAALTVACDGRSSTVRSAVGLKPHSFGAPMDVWWFRLPRRPDDPSGLAGVLRAGHATIMIDRGDYYQIAYIIPKGTDAEMRAEGIEVLQRALVSMVPWLVDRVDKLTSLDDVKLLDVQLNRLPAGTPTVCCSSATRRTRCRRSAASASIWRWPTRWPPHAYWPIRCAQDGSRPASWPGCRDAAGFRPRFCRRRNG